MTNTALEIVDPKVSSMLDRAGFELMDLSNNMDLTCDKALQWMAKYVSCSPVRLRIDNSKCANVSGKSLSDYLAETVPNPCQ